MAEALRRTDTIPEERYEASKSTWDKIAESQEFKDLMATKRSLSFLLLCSSSSTTSRCRCWSATRRSSCPPK